VEVEHRRRVADAKRSEEEDEDDTTTTKVEKIRIVRISDLCVTHPPWHLVTVLTNIGRSLVFRDQERCENLLRGSEVVDSIVLRPGDLTSQARNDTKASLQVDISGSLPEPAYVGRDDVAALATLLATTSTLDFQPNDNNRVMRDARGVVINDNRAKRKDRRRRFRRGGLSNDIDDEYNDDDTDDNTHGINKHKTNGNQNRKSKHWTIAVRWAGATMLQGTKKDGHATPEKCVDYIIRQSDRNERTLQRKIALKNANALFGWWRMPFSRDRSTSNSSSSSRSGDVRRRRKRVKPYGVFVLLAMVMSVYPVIASMLYKIGMKIPVVEALGVKIGKMLWPVWVFVLGWVRLAMQKMVTQFRCWRPMGWWNAIMTLRKG